MQHRLKVEKGGVSMKQPAHGRGGEKSAKGKRRGGRTIRVNGLRKGTKRVSVKARKPEPRKGALGPCGASGMRANGTSAGSFVTGKGRGVLKESEDPNGKKT